MGELCVEGIRRDQIMALPSVLNYRIWSSAGPRSLPGLARRGPSTKLRKSLFGPVDHAENLRFVREELDKISREDSERWNFDFATEQPQEGRYEWAAVGEAATESSQSTRLTCLTAATSNKKQVKRLQASPPGKLKQTLCTDFFRITSSKTRSAFSADTKLFDSAKYARLRLSEASLSESKENATLSHRENANNCVEMR
ncbi:uncharacterized protein LOC119583672 [Penaeus monodon]|uniref:uncharacterized protein LOC119583672 n=1 Tax=Penaeus monodon TaxID=6687 RepID=UPI0018A7A6BC|nr:uncharacterized protein LOC119583672 [Penaeus monodon]